MSFDVSGPPLPHTPRPPLPIALRELVMARDGRKCVYCGTEERLSMDHIRPFTQGGTTEASNLVTACQTCNIIAGNRLFPELSEKKRWIAQARELYGSETLARVATMLTRSDVAGARAQIDDA